MPRSSDKKKGAKIAKALKTSKAPKAESIAPPVSSSSSAEPPAAPSMEDALRKIEAELPPPPAPSAPPAPPGPDDTGGIIEALVEGDQPAIEREAGKATPEELGEVIDLLFWGWGKSRAWWIGRRRPLTLEQRRFIVGCWELHSETSERLGRYLLRTLERHGVEVAASILGDLVTVGLFASALMHHADAEADYLAKLGPVPTQVDA